MGKNRLMTMAVRSNQEDIYPRSVAVEYDPADDVLPQATKTAKYLCLYLEAQPVRIDDEDRMVGRLRFDLCPVPSDVFMRKGHQAFAQVSRRFYCKTDDNLTVFEWQHSNADFGKIIRLGITGFLQEIEDSRKNHSGQTGELFFLAAMEKVCHGIIDWAQRCAHAAREKSVLTTDPRRKAELVAIADRLLHVPEYPARNFAEAVQAVYLCWQFLPDSLGLPDRYLRPFYEREIADGTLSRSEAKEMLQELFIAINGYTPPTSGNFDRGGESHFTIGGYLPDQTDGFNDLSQLIVQAMMELPLYRPQLSLRWTKKTPTAVLRFLLDCERHDKFKRIALVNDEPRLHAYINLAKLSFEKACRYVMVGCNEPTFEGSVDLTGIEVNLMQSLLSALSVRNIEVCAAANFDEFWKIFDSELKRTMTKALDRMNEFNVYRAGDENVLSSIFIDGCIRQACACTRGGAYSISCSPSLMGYVTLIDALIAIRQFVFEEKLLTMRQLTEILERDWAGAEDIRNQIQKKGHFFGNNDAFSNAVAVRLTDALAGVIKDKTTLFGAPILWGNLAGYHPHQAHFGKLTPATPDGRHAGDPLHLGSTPIGGHDHNGLTATLQAVAAMAPSGSMSGSSVFNLSLDYKLMADDNNFEKTVLLLETFFRLGGLHVQLNYVDRKTLLDAKKNPAAHQDLRVRVSGFSGYFVRLEEGMQNDVISRTEQR